MNKLPAKLPKITPFPCSCCGKLINELPENTRVMDEGDELDGWYFECSCRSTQFIPINSSRIAA